MNSLRYCLRISCSRIFASIWMSRSRLLTRSGFCLGGAPMFMSEALCSKIDMWYLHGPDRTTDYAVTLKTIDELHREGKFNRFGISNYTALGFYHLSDF
jgi:hypothetical protein